MSNTNWYWVSSVSQLFLFLNWFGIFIRVVNELLSCIFTTSFSDKFTNFHCEDPFIVLLNVSWRLKWFSKIFWYLECWSDTRSWRGFMLFFIKYWSLESMSVIIWVSPICIGNQRPPYFLFCVGGMRSSFYADQWRDNQHLLLVYSWKYQSIETIIMISNYTGTRIYRCINKTELEPIYVTLTTRK